MKKPNKLKTAALVLLTAALLCTVIASFAPFSVELFLGFAGAFLIGYAVCRILTRDQRPLWLTCAMILLVGVSVIMTLVLLIGKALSTVICIQTLNLCVAASECIASFVKKERFRALACTLAALECLQQLCVA